jgi:hypothetical protein
MFAKNQDWFIAAQEYLSSVVPLANFFNDLTGIGHDKDGFPAFFRAFCEYF